MPVNLYYGNKDFLMAKQVSKQTEYTKYMRCMPRSAALKRKCLKRSSIQIYFNFTLACLFSFAGCFSFGDPLTKLPLHIDRDSRFQSHRPLVLQGGVQIHLQEDSERRTEDSLGQWIWEGELLPKIGATKRTDL